MRVRDRGTRRTRRTDARQHAGTGLDRLTSDTYVKSPPTDPNRPVSRWALSRRKRAIDIAVSAAGLALLSPLLGATSLAVRHSLGTPLIFVQDRPGKNALVFRIRKYRSMTNDTDDQGHLLPPDQRLTRFGRLLRSTSLDELPELVNVLVGDMSLVGPRPLRTEYVDRYSPEQARRLLVRPGITGLAQVNGRNLLEWEDRFALDVEYVDTATLGSDMKILVSTLLQVFRRHGVQPHEADLVSPFAGPRLES